MADLRNPDQAAGWVEMIGGEPRMNSNGLIIRNDGMLLTPAESDPWYVLMTVAGEHSGSLGGKPNLRLMQENSRYWNAWACSEMSVAKKQSSKANWA